MLDDENNVEEGHFQLCSTDSADSDTFSFVNGRSFSKFKDRVQQDEDSIIFKRRYINNLIFCSCWSFIKIAAVAVFDCAGSSSLKS